ncbi:hypothetical protein D3C84_1118820 [compost metagenome]
MRHDVCGVPNISEAHKTHSGNDEAQKAITRDDSCSLLTDTSFSCLISDANYGAALLGAIHSSHDYGKLGSCVGVVDSACFLYWVGGDRGYTDC